MRKATGLAALALASLAFASLAVAHPSSVFRLTLAGADPEGTGEAVLKINRGQSEICYEILVQGIGEPHEPLGSGLGAAHIHFVATGGIAVNLQASFEEVSDDVFAAEGCVEVDPDLLAEILSDPEAFYINIHTLEFPAGAVEARLAEDD